MGQAQKYTQEETGKTQEMSITKDKTHKRQNTQKIKHTKDKTHKR